MYEMSVDPNQGGMPTFLSDNVVVPDFVEERLRSHWQPSTSYALSVADCSFGRRVYEFRVLVEDTVVVL